MTDRLYHLLPRIVRVRDAETGEPLRQLLAVFDEQLELIETDIAGMYDDLFIETCSDDVVARLGSVVGSHDGATRSEVANILRHRGAQGLASTLTRLAREATGHAVDITEVAPGQLDVAIHAEDSQPVSGVAARARGGLRAPRSGAGASSGGAGSGARPRRATPPG